MNHALEERLYEAGGRHLAALSGADEAHARRRSLDRFRGLGLPSKRDEAWRYLPLRRLFTEASTLPLPGSAEAARAAVAECVGGLDLAPTFVFVDGVLAEGLSATSLPAGLELLQGERLAEDPWARDRGHARAGTEADGVAALGAALAPRRSLVRISARLDVPILVVHLSTASGAAPLAFGHTWLHLAAGARAQLVQVFGSARGATATYTHDGALRLEEGAELSESRVVRAGAEASFLLRAEISVGAGARYLGNQQLLSGRVSRSEVSVELEADAEVSLSGLALARRDEHAEHELRVHHRGPRARSEQSYRSIADGSAHTAFSGRVIVDELARGAVAHQSNKNLLLSRTAEVDTRPQLEIYAKEVEASHGATVGQIDEDQVFYLASRGIDEETARGLLRAAFVEETFSPITVDTVRDWVRRAALVALGAPAPLLDAAGGELDDG